MEQKAGKENLVRAFQPHKMHNSQTQKQTFLQRPKSWSCPWHCRHEVSGVFQKVGQSRSWLTEPHTLIGWLQKWVFTHYTAHRMGPATLPNLIFTWVISNLSFKIETSKLRIFCLRHLFGLPPYGQWYTPVFMHCFKVAAVVVKAFSLQSRGQWQLGQPYHWPHVPISCRPVPVIF